MAVRGVKERYWPMRSGGPYDDKPGQSKSSEIFKCTGCGAETEHPAGFNGEPDKHRCHPGCPCHSDVSVAQSNKAKFNKNFERIFPNAPGAGL